MIIPIQFSLHFESPIMSTELNNPYWFLVVSNLISNWDLQKYFHKLIHSIKQVCRIQGYVICMYVWVIKLAIKYIAWILSLCFIWYWLLYREGTFFSMKLPLCCRSFVSTLSFSLCTPPTWAMWRQGGLTHAHQVTKGSSRGQGSSRQGKPLGPTPCGNPVLDTTRTKFQTGHDSIVIPLAVDKRGPVKLT